MAPLTERCPVCGFDPPSVPASDVVVAARSFPRRYRSLLVRPEDEQELVFRQPPGGGLSAVAHAAAAAGEMRAAAGALQRIAVADEPVVDLRASTADGDLDAVLASVEDAAAALASAAGAVQGGDWKRTATVGGNTVSALDIARHGVHGGSHHLREAQRALDAAR